jgi:hypothetical protein
VWRTVMVRRVGIHGRLVVDLEVILRRHQLPWFRIRPAR